MKAKWVVDVIRLPSDHSYAAGFFPRGFVYKDEARVLLREVLDKGGDAVVVKAVNGWSRKKKAP